MSGCCQHRQASVSEAGRGEAIPEYPGDLANPSYASGMEWAALAVLIILAGLAMNLNLSINVSTLEGSTRSVLHGALALAGVVAMVLGGWDLFRPAWLAIREYRIVTEHLFLAGIFAAWGVSLHATLTGSGAVFYEVPILLPAIRRFGGIVLGNQRSRITAAAHEALAGISTARLMHRGEWRVLPLSFVSVGDTILVHAGETIPADSVITHGRAYVQTAPLTGEPFPVALEVGSRVSAGMVALDGELRLQVRAAPRASELFDIAAFTQTLLERPPRYLRSVERVLAWFFPAVLATSLATFAFWAWHSGWYAAIAHSLAVVLVACPCAFGVALPMLFRRGVSACLQRGVEPCDGSFMEALSLVRVVAFDKTGTLTVPEMAVASIICAPDVEESTLRSLLAVIHSRSSHPVARPFWPWASEGEGIEVESVSALPGRGIEARVRVEGLWRGVRLGHFALMQVPYPAWAETGGSQRRLFIEIDGVIAGVCLLTEELRGSSIIACARLAALNYRVILLTGDASVPPGISGAFHEAYTAQRPAEKAAKVNGWEGAGMPVLFIGDGFNDASALASATASIAVGEGPAIAAASAKARWRRPDFAILPELCREARVLSERGRLILWVALSYNSFGMAIAAFGLLHPVTASVIMLVSSTTVTALAAKGFASSTDRASEG